MNKYRISKKMFNLRNVKYYAVLFLMFPTLMQAQTIKISGNVTDEKDIPLAGANVIVIGTTNGTQTDFDGNYTITAESSATLQFSYIGYISKEIAVSGQTNINITMLEDASLLDEVVVVGYGSIKKADLTGAVSSISSKDLVKTTSNNIGQAIQGHMSGVQVTTASGAPGASSEVKIRGVGSINSNNGPLILIDGFVGNMNNISPNEIESISVLKDAASAAIYGARAANGVVLITTKRGKEGKLKIDFKSETSTQSATQLIDIIDGPTWAQKQNEARIYRGQEPFWVGDQAPATITEWTDWMKYYYQTAPRNQYDLSMMGGNEKIKFAAMLSYLDQDGILNDNGNYKRLTGRINLDAEISPRLRAGFSLNLNKANTYSTGGNNTNNTGRNMPIEAFQVPPTIPMYNPDGLPGAARSNFPGEQGQFGWASPIVYMNNSENKYEDRSSFAQGFLEYDITKDLKFKSVWGGTLSSSYSSNWDGTWAVYSPEDVNYTSPVTQNNLASLINDASNNYRWEVQNYLTYSKYFKEKHKIDLLIGISTEGSGGQNFSAKGSDFPNNSIRVLSAAANMVSINGTDTESALNSQFGRLNYSYDGKYLLQFNLRRDGSSVFAPENQYGVFPSFSAGWRISDENFFKPIDFIENMKIRLGYGQLGNANIPAYSWVNTLSVTGVTVFGSPQSLNAAYYPTDMSNEDVKWETTTTIDLGLDISFLQNKLQIVADYYNKSTTDLLLQATVPQSSGYSNGPMINIGEVQNKGWEMNLSYTDKIDDLNYNVHFNLSHNENKVINMGGIPRITTDTGFTDEGYAINTIFGYKTDGIWKSVDEINNNPHRANVGPGDLKYVDTNQDGKISPDDRAALGNSIPKYYYGFGSNLDWNGFDFSVLFQGEKDKYILMPPRFGTDLGNQEQPTDAVIWQYYWDNRAILNENGTQVLSGTTPVLGSSRNGDNSDFWMENASYLRIKNLQLGYSLSGDAIGVNGINNIRLYLSGTNLITWTKFKGFDPEVQPPTNGNALVGGIARNSYPQVKTYSIGFNITF